jgi:hypothetical protein
MTWVPDAPAALACQNAGLREWTANLARSSSHPVYADAYDLQSLKCWTCGDEIDRSADVSGRPHESEIAR